jgi:hypothetical protein
MKEILLIAVTTVICMIISPFISQDKELKRASTEFSIHNRIIDMKAGSIIVEYHPGYNLVTYCENGEQCYTHQINVEYPEEGWSDSQALDFDTESYVKETVKYFEGVEKENQ